MLKELIQWVAARGLTVAVYYGFQVVAFIAVFFVAAWYGRKLRMGAWKAIITFAIVYPLTDLWKRVLFWIESGFQVFGGENFIRVLIYVPVIAYFVAVFLKIDRKRMCDFLAPCVVLSYGIGHFGCIFEGCCAGYPCAWGLYNIDTGLIHFPMPLIEASTALLIFVYLLYRTQKLDYAPDGQQYPIMLFLFGSTRFIWEFFRDNEKIWMGCSSLSFHALLACIIGMVTFLIVKHRTEKHI